jgi:hypothetical protein
MIQWSMKEENTKEIIRSHKTKKTSWYNGQVFFVLWLLIIPLVFPSIIDHCIIWSSLLYGFWLSLWYFPLSLTIVSSGLLCFMTSDYPFGISLFHWPLYHLVFLQWSMKEENTKGIIRSHKAKKTSWYNGQWKRKIPKG